MRKRLTYLSLSALLIAAATAAYVLAPASSGQSQRGQCEQNCTQQQQACRSAANANRDECNAPPARPATRTATVTVTATPTRT